MWVTGPSRRDLAGVKSAGKTLFWPTSLPDEQARFDHRRPVRRLNRGALIAEPHVRPRTELRSVCGPSDASSMDHFHVKNMAASVVVRRLACCVR